ncbi:hypothetical protein [Phaeobacter sp. B1627]|uniref:hypothetical protein n=1 Tax=Phaeobacter sp. B1627 TaxID=2583809 RepID=UPI00111B413C|nr:hypothetical protein [Phaeobacter sp. B1627]TNJ38756.1 hypothetical protein FGE21_19490 [Phaeobacter sp. B1627]
MARLTLGVGATVQSLGDKILRAGIEYKTTGHPSASAEAAVVALLTTPPNTTVQFHYDDLQNLHIVVPNTNQIATSDLDTSDPGASRLKRIAAEGLGAAVILGCQM